MQVENVSRAVFGRGLLAVLVLGLALVFGGSFDVGFYFRDAGGITANPAIRDLSNLPKYFTDPFTLSSEREDVDVRPVLVTTFALNHAVSGVEPWSYHAFNLLVHLLTSWLVFLIVRDHLWWPIATRGPEGIARWPAAAVAICFALAPLNNQAVNYMWARAELLGTAFYVAAFLSLLNGRLLLAVALHVLALWTTPVALTLPLMFVAYDYIYRDPNRHPDTRAWLADWRELLIPLTPLVAANGLCLLHRLLVLPAWANVSAHDTGVTSWVWMCTQWSVLLHYATAFVWPSGLTVDHNYGYVRSLGEPAAWGALVVLVAWIVAAGRNSWRFPHVAFATTWFFVALAPESSLWPQSEVVTDHRPYLASTLGLSVLLVWMVDRAARWAGPRRGEAFVGMVTVLFLSAAVVGHLRTGEWASEDKLWQSTARADPNNAGAWIKAGLAYMRRGDMVEARRHLEQARNLRRGDPFVYVHLSALEQMTGNRDAAIVWAEEAVKYGDGLPKTHAALGEALRLRGRLRDAVAEMQRAADLDPSDVALQAALQRVENDAAVAEAGRTDEERMKEGLRFLDVEGNPERAIPEFRAILANTPGDEAATWQLARALDAAGQREKAREVWQELLLMTQKNGDAIGAARVRERLSQ